MLNSDYDAHYITEVRRKLSEFLCSFVYYYLTPEKFLYIKTQLKSFSYHLRPTYSNLNTDIANVTKLVFLLMMRKKNTCVEQVLLFIV